MSSCSKDTVGTEVRTQADEDFNVVWAARSVVLVGDKKIEVHVVGKRCVVINGYRVAGSKPYVSENLPWHELKTTLIDVLNAFSEADILAALEEKRVTARYFADYHARKASRAALVRTAPAETSGLITEQNKATSANAGEK